MSSDIQTIGRNYIALCWIESIDSGTFSCKAAAAFLGLSAIAQIATYLPGEGTIAEEIYSITSESGEYLAIAGVAAFATGIATTATGYLILKSMEPAKPPPLLDRENTKKIKDTKKFEEYLQQVALLENRGAAPHEDESPSPSSSMHSAPLPDDAPAPAPPRSPVIEHVIEDYFSVEGE